MRRDLLPRPGEVSCLPTGALVTPPGRAVHLDGDLQARVSVTLFLSLSNMGLPGTAEHVSKGHTLHHSTLTSGTPPPSAAQGGPRDKPCVSAGTGACETGHILLPGKAWVQTAPVQVSA